jgi:hypothetical protein
LASLLCFPNSRTSTHQTLETDQPDPTTGLIDGLPPLTKESKITIVAAARDYVVHLRREREKLDRQRKGLEEFIKGIEGGEAALEAWKQVRFCSLPSSAFLPKLVRIGC